MELEGIKIINLTPHPVIVFGDNYKIIKIFESNGVARVDMQTREVARLNGIPFVTSDFTQVMGLPKEEKGTYYIVSYLVKIALPHRGDLLNPVGHVKNEQGEVIGCKGLSIN